MVTLNFLAGTFAIVEVSEPGFEAITYALVTTANNATIPLSVVISYQVRVSSIVYLQMQIK